VRPSERLTLGALLALLALTVALEPPGAVPRIGAFVAMLAATLWFSSRLASGAPGFVRDWLPVAEVLTIFLLLQPIIEATVPWRLDAALAAADQRYLGGLVAAWQGAFGRARLFTDASYVAYFSYYGLPLVAAAIARTRGPVEFERVVFALLLAFYLTFIGYLLLPASGPRVPAALEATLLGGGVASEAVRTFLHAAEATTLDAFPSGHTTVAVVSAAMGSRGVSRAGAGALWLWAAGVVFSTVYIHVHYATDVVAGLALAVLVLWIAPRGGSTTPSALTPSP